MCINHYSSWAPLETFSERIPIEIQITMNIIMIIMSYTKQLFEWVTLNN